MLCLRRSDHLPTERERAGFPLLGQPDHEAHSVAVEIPRSPTRVHAMVIVFIFTSILGGAISFALLFWSHLAGGVHLRPGDMAMHIDPAGHDDQAGGVQRPRRANGRT